HQGLARLIEGYTDGYIPKVEFEPRISRLRQRIAHFEEMLRQERDEADTLHEMRLLMGQIEEFAGHVRQGLTEANWQLRRDIIRALVKRVEVTDEHITIVFRVGTHVLGPAPPGPSWQHWLPRLPAQASECFGAVV